MLAMANNNDLLNDFDDDDDFELFSYKELLNDDGTMKNKDSLQSLFKKARINQEKPIITTCGSGVTAAIISLALEIVGYKNHSVYDGSWTEWGQFDQLPVEVG